MWYACAFPFFHIVAINIILINFWLKKKLLEASGAWSQKKRSEACAWPASLEDVMDGNVNVK